MLADHVRKDLGPTEYPSVNDTWSDVLPIELRVVGPFLDEVDQLEHQVGRHEREDSLDES